MARRILAGDIFLSSGNTNMLYPNSGALYFEALQFPASLAAVPLLAAGMRPELAYHIVLALFWALAAPCVRFLLRELDCRPLSATVGALIFTILPLRTRYMVALQLELVFALPLFYAFVVRFLRRPNVKDAIMAALSWWLLAVSELNTAVFSAVMLPPIAVAFLSASPQLLASRKFWLSACAGAAMGAASICFMLAPYLVQRGEGAVDRTLKEIIKNSGQPFAYLKPWGRFRLFDIPLAIPDENSLYPTLALIALAALACGLWLLHSLRRTPAANADFNSLPFMGAKKALEYLGVVIRIAAPLTCLLYALLLLPRQLELCEFGKTTAKVFRQMSNLVVIFAVALAFTPAKGESWRTTFLRGFASAAVLSCLLSFGPLLKMGRPYAPLLSRSNHFYKTVLEFLPLLSSFRTVSRFGILVVFFVFCAAICALDVLLRRTESAPRRGGGAAHAGFRGICGMCH